MAMLSPGARERGRRRALNAEINVTPFVDVMLVLLIVFMITAPLLTTGVDVALPKTKAETLPAASQQPLTVTVTADGTIYVMQEAVEPDALIAKLEAVARTGYDERIYLRGDGALGWESGVDVMARIQAAGFRNIAIVTDPKSR